MKSPLNRGGLRFYLVLASLFGGAISLSSIVVGLPSLLLGVALHTWAKGCLRQNRVVATIGPYRFVRHPFYLANALIDGSIAAMSGWWPLQVVLPLWWLAIYLPVMRGEERYLCENFPDEYPDYMRRLPRLIPWRRPLPSTGEGFQWSNPNIAGGEEIPRALRILAYPALFFLVQGLRDNDWTWLSDGWHLTVLGCFLTLHGLAWEVQKNQRREERILPQFLSHWFYAMVFALGMFYAEKKIKGPATTCGEVMTLAAIALLVLFFIAICAIDKSSDTLVSAEAKSRRKDISRYLGLLSALLSCVVSSEKLWLAAPIILVYAAWILDCCLRPTDSAMAVQCQKEGEEART